MATKYPVGYGTQRITMAALERKFGPAAPIPAHPEFWRRLKAWLIAQGGAVGIGGAYRYTQPDKPGFAPAGKSFHERQKFASGFSGYSAVDLVVATEGGVRAPTWSEVPRQGTNHPDISDFGLHCNVPGEPWHMQCREIDGWSSWASAGRPDPAKDHPINGDAIPEPPPGNGLPPISERRTLKLQNPKMNGLDVAWVQQVVGKTGMSIDVDGWFGTQTRARVKTIQGWNGLVQDGIVGPNTWAVLDQY